MNNKKHYFHWLVTVLSLGWSLYYTFANEMHGFFWLIIASIILFLLIGTLSIILESPLRKIIRKNMTIDENITFDAISTNAGTALGMRAAPFALISGMIFMVFGLDTLLYFIPVAVLLLIALCMPVWRNIRRDIDQALLSSDYAVTNGITTLRRNANKASHPIAASRGEG